MLCAAAVVVVVRCDLLLVVVVVVWCYALGDDLWCALFVCGWCLLLWCVMVC